MPFKSKSAIIASLALVLSTSCEKIKGVEGMEDLEAPKITLLSPNSEDFRQGDTLFISVSVIDNDGLHDLYIGLNNMSSWQKVMHWSVHQHGKSAQVDTFYVFPSSGSPVNYELQIESSDHTNNRCSLRKSLMVE